MNVKNVYQRNGPDVCCMNQSRESRLEFFRVLRAGYDRAN